MEDECPCESCDWHCDYWDAKYCCTLCRWHDDNPDCENCDPRDNQEELMGINYITLIVPPSWYHKQEEVQYRKLQKSG